MHTLSSRMPHLAGSIAAALLLSAPAHANPISPALWPPVFPMVAANVVIGLGEAFVLAVFYGTAMRRAAMPMVLANLVSAIVGFPAMLHIHESGLFYTAAGYPIMSQGWQQVTCVLAAYLLAILIELPFVAYSLEPGKYLRRRAWKGSWLVQTVSYAICVPLLYLMLDRPLYQLFYR